MKGQMIKQKGFVRRLLKRLEARRVKRMDHKNFTSERELASLQRLAALTEDDIDVIVSEFWKEIALLIRGGTRVIFEGWISFFTKPVKRKCYDITSGREWWTLKRRVRSNPLDRFREDAEVEISEEEYNRERQKN